MSCTLVNINMSASTSAACWHVALSSHSRGILAAIGLAMLASASALHAMTDTEAIQAFYFGSRDYNLITFGDYTLGTSGTWGGIAVGGTFTDTLGKATIVEGTPYIRNAIHTIPGRSLVSDPTAIFNGKINVGTQKDVRIEVGNSGTVALNSSTVPGSSSGNQYTITGTGQLIQAAGFTDLNTTTSVVNFSTLQTSLSKAQTALANSAPTLTAAEYSYSSSSAAITINAQGSGIDYLNINASTLNSNKLNLTVGSGDLLVINLHVDAAKLSIGEFIIDNNSELSSSPYLTNTTANRVLWNVIFDTAGISTLTIDSTTGAQIFWGSILSTADSIISNDRVTGQVIANNFTNTETELHMALLETDVPEPSTVALGLGTLALGFAFWRRRQQRK